MGSGLLIKTVRFVKKEKIECQSAGGEVNEKKKVEKERYDRMAGHAANSCAIYIFCLGTAD